ncbi:hypothetical protein [Kitasatospora sp. NPDC002040]|uniref:hypothetical protein n=1 Tax=Kitasatospora sp. NPDC002040 TaxID=3154661 RepID=UPI0033232935
MMFGYSDDWMAVLMIPVVFWVPFGPFLMGAVGAWCARRPGWRPRLVSVLLPAVPVGVSAVSMFLPPESWDDERFVDDLVGYLIVYVGGITLLPWLLGFLGTRYTRMFRARRARRSLRTGAGAGAP